MNDVFLQKTHKSVSPFKSSWKIWKKQEFYTKQCGLYSLKHFFPKTVFLLFPFTIFTKHNFLFEKIKLLLFHEKKCFIEKNPTKKAEKEPPELKKASKLSFTFPTKVRGVRLCLSIYTHFLEYIFENSKGNLHKT